MNATHRTLRTTADEGRLFVQVKGRKQGRVTLLLAASPDQVRVQHGSTRDLVRDAHGDLALMGARTRHASLDAHTFASKWVPLTDDDLDTIHNAFDDREVGRIANRRLARRIDRVVGAYAS